MRISTRGRYALRFLVDLAENQGESDYISLKDISERQKISKKYLEQIVSYLSKAEIIDALRGFRGGYRLSRDPSEISLYEIFSCSESDFHISPCVEDSACERKDACPANYVWQDLENHINLYLKDYKLSDVVTQHRNSLDKLKNK